MAAIIRTVQHLCPDIKERLLKGVPVVLHAATKEAAQRGFYNLLSCLIGGKAVYAVKITFPHLGVFSKILKGDFRETAQSVRASMIFCLNRSPRDLVRMIAGNSLQEMTLKKACDTLANLSTKQIICIAVVPIIAPSPFTAKGLITYVVSLFPLRKIVVKREDIVKLDDLKDRKDDEVECKEFDSDSLEDAIQTPIDSHEITTS